MPTDGISSAVLVAQMSTLTNIIGASTITSRGNMLAASVLHVVNVEKMLALAQIALVAVISTAAPVVQMSTASGISLPVDVNCLQVDTFDAFTIPSNTSLPAQPSNGVPPQTALDNSGDSTFEVLDG
ncbi:unnamed protein product [Dovyalis caffra]|uniref:Uncharacterized protein n=1 Tax=Dovyalis caffra TaxID=77055 RepID=A0AAV1SNI9_9ROSI|nr:unnamed protein product [Dovyalis caffra]